MVEVEEAAVVAARVILSAGTMWISAGASLNVRLYSGFVTSLTCAILSFAFLEPRFLGVGIPLADVALYILAILASLVGLSLGVLMPTVSTGACAGAGFALLTALGFSPEILYFPVFGGAMALIGAVICSQCCQSKMLPLAIILVSGGLAACFAWSPLFPYITDVALGYDHMATPLTKEAPILKSPTLALIWLAGSFLTALATLYRSGGLRTSKLVGLLRGGYEVLPSATPGSAPAKPRRSTFERSPPSIPSATPDTYNMFNSADLPPRLAEYANMVYHACEDLGNFFGFQDSSVRNQAEHLLILLSNNRRYMTARPPHLSPPSPIHALHAKVFSNYFKWCKSLQIAPIFSKISSTFNGINNGTGGPPAVVSRVVDLTLYFCIWGEGANLRHMPECCWFLYHKMMEEYVLQEGFAGTRSLYAGWFLDSVIEPVYEIVAENMKSKSDHMNKRNYDDFNEFFWSRKCLQFRYSSSASPPTASTTLESGAAPVQPQPSDHPFETVPPPITEGLLKAPKSFLEKRSWLRGILALNRVIEWHIITFYLLAVVAFSRQLVWGWVYSMRVASGVFWLYNVIHLTWQLIEVWSIYPGIQLTATATCGSIFTIVSRFFILIYQTLYLMWTFGPHQSNYFGMEADGNFWWWQYIWLSLLCMAPYLAQAMLQLYPALTTKIYTSQSDYVQSFLNILFPLSRLYVGKEVHESFWRTSVYIIFWITLIAWKLLFSYWFEVSAMVLPTLELTDDFINFPNQSFAKMSLLLIMRWSPQLVVYFIDMSIWYAVWQAFAGTSVGFSEHLGDVKNIDEIRKNFGRAPEEFCRKMLSPDAGSRRGSSTSFLTNSGNNLINPNQSAEGVSLLGSDPHKLQSYVNRLLDVRIQKWVMFSAAWNEIIDYFRTEDILSNRERDFLKFSRFEGFSQAIYLPVFQTAGMIDNSLVELERPIEVPIDGKITDELYLKPIHDNTTMSTAISEAWELGNFLLLKLLGMRHNDDIVAINNLILKWTQNQSLCEHLKMKQMRGLMNNFVGLVSLLQKGIGKRKPQANRKQAVREIPKRATRMSVLGPTTASMTSQPARKMRRVHSASSLVESAEPAPSMEFVDSMTMHKSKRETKNSDRDAVLDALRDQVRDKVRNIAQSLKGMLMNTGFDTETQDVLDRITFLLSVENGFLWDDGYAADQLDDVARNGMFKEVLSKLFGLVACHPDDVEPKSKEVRRRLTFFVNSLFMNIPNAPSIQDMFSWNVMTPFYSEDVTYSRADLDKRSDALGVSTMLYLKTIFKADWQNFLERLDIQDEEKVWSKNNKEETRIWASIRAQTLSRTVTGMMYYEKALRLLANLERLDESTIDNLMGEKFGYIVTCQIYGKMKKEQDSKAEDIEQLMHRFPHMRVAYIDTVRLNRAGASIFYSVLVKSDGKGNIKEVYRVRLPGNPVIGEGKPENQNHAIIFTRGELVQTIDMNQEGYFEEALKMRNALQEFGKREGPLPTTILGLREHIFTGAVSSLANYMASQELSFVTLGQRVLAKPLCIRLHYGHPDVFDKLFFMTRGGISKASKGINLSEDIFAGYNNVIRGGQTTFKEYSQVGKGRDVGMSQIYKFEAKLSQGAAEQSLSRDVYRVCHRLDFFRLFSLFYGGIGHYFSNVLTVLTIYIVVYLMVVLAVYDLEKIGDRIITPMGTIQMLLGGLGLLQTIPLFATLGVERGWWYSFREIVHIFITGGPLHFMFHIQTKAYYMSQTILVGGAKYRPTGRGFVTQHTPMDEQYRFFASSHLYLGVELGAALLIMGCYTQAGQYFGRTWSMWLASISFIASPFWFNPLTYEWEVVMSDYEKYIRWMRGTSGGAEKSWSMWWTDENAYYKTLPFGSKMLFVIKSAIYLLLAEGIRSSNLFRVDTDLYKPWVSVTRVLMFIVVFVALGQLFVMNEGSLPYPIRRTIGIIITIGLIGGILTIFFEDINCVRYALSAYYGVGALCQIGLVAGVKGVKHFYLIHDLVCGHILFIPLWILSALQFKNIQSWLLYRNALSTDVVVSDILRYARKTQEAEGDDPQDEDLQEQVAELRKIVQKQEQMLSDAGFGSGSQLATSARKPLSSASGPTSGATAPPSAYQKPASHAPESAGTTDSNSSFQKRTMSLSGLDVWGDMALGDAAIYERDIPTYNVTGNIMQPAPVSSTQPFTFTQPDTMPPR